MEQSGEPVIIEPGLISEEYRKIQQDLHADESVVYGTASRVYAPLVSQIVNKMIVTHVLDYGCGHKLNLLNNLEIGHKLTYQAYDPAVEEFADRPVPAQMVCCIDVLEHIEPEYLDNVLDDLRKLTEVILFCSIDLAPARKTLSDGRNAHLIQEPMEWWLPKLWERFELQTVQMSNEHAFYVIAYAKPGIELVNGEKAV